MKRNSELMAFKAAMRDMREQKMNTEIIRTRVYENRIRPEEISGKCMNGKPIFF